jgi:hypothetical protein
MTINAYQLGKPETPEQTAHLDSVVHSGTDALILGCIDKVGSITYREALAQYALEHPDTTDKTPTAGKTEYTVTWSMNYEADSHLDAISQAYAAIRNLAVDPSVGANYVTVAYATEPQNKSHYQIDEVMNLLGDNPQVV